MPWALGVKRFLKFIGKSFKKVLDKLFSFMIS